MRGATVGAVEADAVGRRQVRGVGQLVDAAGKYRMRPIGEIDAQHLAVEQQNGAERNIEG